MKSKVDFFLACITQITGGYIKKDMIKHASFEVLLYT